MNNFQDKANFIWQVADDILRGLFKQHEYGDVILPFVVLRRLDCVLNSKKDAVIKTYEQFKDKVPDPSAICLQATGGLKFYNTSLYDLQRLTHESGNIEANFLNYINGFSKNVRDIIDNFGIEKIASKLAKNDLLYMLIDKFTEIDLHPDIVTNHEMGDIFEELLRRFSEMSNETAGEHYTPREVIRLMVNLLFAENKDKLVGKGIIRSIYDPACGTGGMLTIAKDYILGNINSNLDLILFGQESNEQTYAIAKSDMLITGENEENIKLGSSFSSDYFRKNKFDFMLSNPPYGVSWKKEQSFIRNEASDPNGRFNAGLPRISDGALLFLTHMISKMNPEESRIAIILNASPLFSGDAGSGESNIRRWILNNDYLEAVISLPVDVFYNTGIPTFIWILTNRKSNKRKGKIQLINASNHYKVLRRSLGSKKNFITENQIQAIIDSYVSFQNTKNSKLFDNEDFFYTKIAIASPLIKDGKIVRNSDGSPKIDEKKTEYDKVPIKVDTEKFFNEEILPYKPDSWINHSKSKQGCHIPFTYHMLQYDTPKTYEEIVKRTMEIEKEIQRLSSVKQYNIVKHKRYRNVDVDWIENIPENWKILPNRALFEERSEKGDGTLELLSVTQDRGVIKQSDLEIKRDMSNEDKSNYKIVEPGDLVYNKMRMWQGAIGFSKYKGIVSPAYIVLKPKGDIYSKYFYYLFKSPQYIAQSKRFSYGLCDDMNNLRYDDFKRMLAIVPPYEEQVRLTKFLEKKTDTINNLIQKNKELVEFIIEIVTGKYNTE